MEIDKRKGERERERANACGASAEREGRDELGKGRRVEQVQAGVGARACREREFHGEVSREFRELTREKERESGGLVLRRGGAGWSESGWRERESVRESLPIAQ